MSIFNALYPQGDFLNIRANAPTQTDYNVRVTEDLVRNLPGGLLRDIVAPAAAATLSLPYDTIQGISRADSYTPSGIMRAIAAENPLSSAYERFMGASAPLAERLYGSTNTSYTPMMDMVNQDLDPVLEQFYGSPKINEPASVFSQQPFNDYYGPTNIDTSFGVANEEDVEEDIEGTRRKGGLADLFRAALGFAVPGASLFMGGGQRILGGIQNLNQRLRNTTFGRSETLADYFQARRDQKAREAARQRGIDKEMARSGTGRDIRGSDFGGDFGQRAGGGGFSGTGPSSDITGTEGSF